MSDRLRVHPDHPAPRSIGMAADRLRDGQLGILPSDAGYLIAWTLEARQAEERATRLRMLDTRHPFTLLCRSISEIGKLARLEDAAFRAVKAYTPGPQTFILAVGTGLPKRFKQAKRKTIGCRIVDHQVVRDLLDQLQAPLLATSLRLPDEQISTFDAEEVAERALKHVDFMLDAGDCAPGPTTIIDASSGVVEVTRQGWTAISLD